jgi:AraC family transcriptional regulator of adaptative response/methylated-DNA-[protein]-cysteine methyltransferase
VVIAYGAVQTALGATFVAGLRSANGALALCKLLFGDASILATGLAQLQRDWPAAQLELSPASDAALNQLAQAAVRGEAAFTLCLRGTGFQIHVWQALLAIPSGQLVSYGAIAQALGKPKASRAVGTAVGDNPISVLIPCHRVIQRSGALGGYAWGLERKVLLLGRELDVPVEDATDLFS